MCETRSSAPVENKRDSFELNGRGRTPCATQHTRYDVGHFDGAIDPGMTSRPEAVTAGPPRDRHQLS